MIASTPSDLAAAFRSFPRRLREAVAPLGEDQDPATVAEIRALEDRVAMSVREAASVLGLSTRGDLTDVAGSVARELEERPVRNWDDADLNRMRELASGIGASIRSIASQTE